MLLKNKKLFIGLIIIIAIIVICFWWLRYRQKEAAISGVRGECLGENEIASYKIEKKESPLANAIIFIINKNIKNDSFSFKINDIFESYHPIELYSCGVYVIRFFNYDTQKSKQKPDFRAEFWKYQYNGMEENLFLTKDFSYDFRVSPNEKYIVLEKGYLGKEDYSLVIKDLKTKEDIFTLLASSVSAKYPNIVGVFDMLKWSEDSRYFWGSISDGAYVNGYFRIDTQNWKVDIFEAPDGAMGGSDLNINIGYLTIQPGQVWTGDYQMDQDLKEQYRKEGKKSSLYIYNLFTKEKILIVETEEPLWWFKSEWLSDTELQYEMPNGEKKIYKIR